MNVKDVIKEECSLNVCHGCLSVGRSLQHLNAVYPTDIEHENSVYLYRTLLHEDMTFDYSNVVLCWECNAFLRKVHNFQKRIQRANLALRRFYSNVNQDLVSLSSLCLGTTSILFVNENEPNETDKRQSVNISCMAKTDDVEIKLEKYEGKIDIKLEDYSSHSNDEVEVFDNDNNEECESKPKREKKMVFTNEKYVIFNNDYKGERKREKKEVFRNIKYVKIHLNDKSVIIRDYIVEVNPQHFASDGEVEKRCERGAATILSEISYKCAFCQYMHVQLKRAVSHVKTHGSVFKCKKCQHEFGGRKQFFDHYRGLHVSFICDYCGTKFTNRELLIKHMRRHNERHTCEVCHAEFSRYVRYLRHRNTHDRALPAENNYCVECDKHYPSNDHYKKHLYSSVRHRPRKKKCVPCPECGKTFTKTSYMNNHVRVFHTKNSKHRCDKCDKMFGNSYNLRKHIDSVHKKIPKPRNKICETCGRAFTTSKILTHHIRTHTGERPHACPACSATFAQSTALKVHLRAVHKILNKT